MDPRSPTRGYERKQSKKTVYVETRNERDQAERIGSQVDSIPGGHTRRQYPNHGTARKSSKPYDPARRSQQRHKLANHNKSGPRKSA